VDLDWEGSRVGEARQGRPKARLGEDRRVDPVGQLSEFAEGRLRVVGRLGEQRSGLAVAVGLGPGAGQSEVVGEGQQSLLGAIVQVAFQPAPLGVASLDDADAGGSQVVELSQDLGLEPFVFQREPDRGADLALQVGQRCSVGDDRDPAAVPDQRGARAAGGGDGLGDGRPLTST
jgi:hypothetical protein